VPPGHEKGLGSLTFLWPFGIAAKFPPGRRDFLFDGATKQRPGLKLGGGTAARDPPKPTRVFETPSKLCDFLMITYTQV
jgi:hypothetical protein